jgi:hypothetical protein
METDKSTDSLKQPNRCHLRYVTQFGEAFRPFIPKYVFSTYIIGLIYVGSNTEAKTSEFYKKDKNISAAAKYGTDIFLLQAFAVDLIPGGVIRTIVSSSTKVLNSQYMVKKLNPDFVKIAPTLIGLAAMPFIMDPIYRLTNNIMDNSVRKWM